MITPPANIGIPINPKPYKCNACATPIWRWNKTDWVCWNCKLHTHLYSRIEIVDITNLDGCIASGVYRKQHSQEPIIDDCTLPEKRVVYHVGYSKHGTEQALESLLADQNVHLIDTRYKAYSAIPWACGDALSAKYGCRYHYAGKCLGNMNYATKGGPIMIADLPVGIKGLCRYLDEGKDLVLLCGCKEYEACHRSLIVEELKRVRPEIEVVAL